MFSLSLQVCSKATEPGNKNRRRNTGILIRYINSLGRYNILVDAGKYVLSIISSTFKFHSSYKINCLNEVRIEQYFNS